MKIILACVICRVSSLAHNNYLIYGINYTSDNQNYSLRPLIHVFDIMYLDTKTRLDTSCQRQVLAVGGSTII
jgi:hypothetical protein